MALTKALALLSIAASLVAAVTPPQCTSAYGSENSTIQEGAYNVEGYNGNNGASLGMYSIHIGDYSGFGETVLEELPGITQAINEFVPLLRQAVIKCNTCKNGTQTLYRPYKSAVVDYNDLENIFRVGTTVISDSLQYKYCDDVNDGVCQDYRPYCSDGPNGKFRQEHPAKAVKPAIRQYIRANIAAFGTGPASAKAGVPALPAGAIYPYYQCLLNYANKENIGNFEASWFGFMQQVVGLNGTACV